MFLALVAYFALVAVRVLLNYRSLRAYLLLPLVERPAPVDRLPPVTVIVPAGGAERDRQAHLASLEALDYADLDIVVLRDPSPAPLEAGLRPAAPNGPAAAAALAPAAAAARGEWLLISAPGTVHRPESLERVMRFALQRKCDAVSLFLQQRPHGFWEQLLTPFLWQQLFAGIRRPAVAPAAPVLLDAGQYLLVRRDAWSGAHEAAAAGERGAPGAWPNAAGIPAVAARGERLGSARPFAQAAGAREGLQRQVARVIGQPGVGRWTILASALLAILAVPCAIYGLAAGSRAFELAALITYVTAVADLTLWAFLFGAPLAYALLQPLAAVAFLTLAARPLIMPKPRT